MNAIPELTSAQVEKIEALRASSRMGLATAILMDCRLDWHEWQGIKALRAEGFTEPEIIEAFIAFAFGNIFGIIQAEKEPFLRQLLAILAVTEAQASSKKLLEMVK